jgi:hypothetical protein
VVSFLRAFPPKTCTLFSPLPCVPHTPPISFAEYKLWSSSLCCFIHPPVTSSLLHLNILFSALFSNIPTRHNRPDDGGSTYLWNVGRQLFYTAVHPRRQIWTSYSPPWEPEISSPLYVLLFVWKNNFYTHIKQKAKLQIVCFNIYAFRQQMRRKYSEVKCSRHSQNLVCS